MRQDYTKKITKLMFQEIDSINAYASKNRQDLEKANLAELIIDDILGIQSRLTQVALMAEEFNQIHVTKEFIEAIAMKLNNNHRMLIVKNKELDCVIIEQIVGEIRCYIQYFRILERFRRKDKGDLQNLTTYLNSLETLKRYAILPTLKIEIEKEMLFLSKINKAFKTSIGGLYDLLSLIKPKIAEKNTHDLEKFLKVQCLAAVKSE